MHQYRMYVFCMYVCHLMHCESTVWKYSLFHSVLKKANIFTDRTFFIFEVPASKIFVLPFHLMHCPPQRTNTVQYSTVAGTPTQHQVPGTVPGTSYLLPGTQSTGTPYQVPGTRYSTEHYLQYSEYRYSTWYSEYSTAPNTTVPGTQQYYSGVQILTINNFNHSPSVFPDTRLLLILFLCVCVLCAVCPSFLQAHTWT